MRHVVSKVVSYDDLRKYFTGESWNLQEGEGGSVEAKSSAYDVQLKPKSMTFDVEISATDDPSDSETKKVSDPVEFISKFLETGTAADDVLKKMSSVAGKSRLSTALDPWAVSASQDLMSILGSRMAALLEDRVIGLAHVRKILRRATVLMTGRGLRRLIAVASRAAAGNDVKEKEVAGLLKEMKAKGWKVEQSEGENGPTIKVDVSGIYEATIKLDTTMWDYTFKVHDVEESEESGETEDPIQQFRLFYKKDSTQDAKKQLKEKKNQKAEEGTAPANPVGRKKKEEATQEESPRKKDNAESNDDTLFAPTQLPPSLSPKDLDRNKYSD